MNRRLACVATFLAVASPILVLSNVVFACVPQARLVSLSPRAFGPPGSEVRVDVLAVDAGPAEVRWNAPDGPQMATSTGPNFSVTVTIPDVEAGLYSIVVLSRAPGGAVGNAATAAFQVTRHEDRGRMQPAERPDSPSLPSTSSSESRSSSSLVAGVVVSGTLLLLAGALAGRFVTLRRFRKISESSGHIQERL